MVKSSKAKPTIPYKRKATARKSKPKKEPIIIVEFKFQESEIKRMGGITKFCDFIYGCIDATQIGFKN